MANIEEALRVENFALIQRLRDEAKSVKDCFTNFSFQAIAFSTVALGIIANYQKDNPVTALGSIFVIALLLAVARIGTYKYATANRCFGYELHLYRTRGIEQSHGEGWQDYMRSLGWEEAVRAWRVVQATVFDHLYYTDFFRPNYLRRTHRKQSYKWFQPASLIVKGAAYHAGSYLKTMLGILYTIALLSLIPLLFMIMQLEQRPNPQMPLSTPMLWSAFGVFAFVVLHRIAKTDARRRVLEGGLLCIHSCAIMWQAVTVAHYRALHLSQKQDSGKGLNYEEYTRHLSLMAIDLKKNIFRIHEWIRGELP